MTTVEQVARAALADLAIGSEGLANAIRWVNERISQVASRRMKHRRQISSVVIPAPITAGALSTTTNQQKITPDATALTALLAAADFSGAFVQFSSSSTWYQIQGFDGTVLLLDQPWATTALSAVAYRLVYRHRILPVEAVFLGTFVHGRMRHELTVKSQEQLDMLAPERPYVTGGPYFYSLFGDDAGRRVLEFYPYATQAEYLSFTYWEQAPVLPKDAPIPSPFTAADLKTGVLADCYRYKAMLAYEAGKVDIGNAMSNLAARQETLWSGKLQDIARRDRGVEDLTLLLGRSGSEPILNRNAHTEVYLRGNRP